MSRAAMRAEWNALVAKLAAEAGADAVARGSSNMARYFAYLAYESGNSGEAIRILAESLRASRGCFWAIREIGR